MTQYGNALKQKALFQIDNARILAQQRIGTIKQYEPNWGAKWKLWNDSKAPTHTGAILSRIVYGTLNDAKIAFTRASQGRGSAHGLDNVIVSNYKERVGAGLFTLANVVLPLVAAIETKIVKVDLMGGKVSKYGDDFINYDIYASSGIKDDVANFSKHFSSNSVSEIVVNNPQAEFLTSVNESLKSGGTITVRGQMSNKQFKSIWEGNAKGFDSFEVVEGSRKTGLPNSGYTRTDGTPLGGSNNLNELILRKKE